MPDQNIALGVQVPDQMKPLSGMLNLATQAQDYQRGKVALQKDQALLQPQIEQGKAQSETAQQTAMQQRLVTLREHMANGVSQLAQLHGTGATPDQVRQVLTDTLKNAGAPPEAMTQSLAGVPSDPAQIDRFIVQKMASAMQMASQLDKIAPSATMVNTGGNTVPVATGNPELTSVKPGTVQGQPIANTMAPGTNETVEMDAQGNKFVVSRSPQGSILSTRPMPGTSAPGSPSQGGGFAAFAPGQKQVIEANAGTAAEDWKQTISASQKASQNIGVLQEIKKYAPGAVAGVAQDRRAFLTGLAGLVGMDVGQMEKTETDLLAKNTNMLALAGGNTNLAKELAEVANPNVHMTKEAITRAANQVIAQQQMLLVRAQHLQKFANDPQGYTQAATEFNAHADPRVLQYPSLSVADRIEMKKAMSPREQAEFGRKLQFFQQNGYLK